MLHSMQLLYNKIAVPVVKLYTHESHVHGIRMAALDAEMVTRIGIK